MRAPSAAARQALGGPHSALTTSWDHDSIRSHAAWISLASARRPRELVVLPHGEWAAGGVDLVDEPQVHGSDRVPVVVQHADERELRVPVRLDLLTPLPPQAGGNRVRPVIDRVDVSAHADRCPPMQARISRRRTVRSMRKARSPSRTTTYGMSCLWLGSCSASSRAIQAPELAMTSRSSARAPCARGRSTGEVRAARHRVSRDDQDVLSPRIRTVEKWCVRAPGGELRSGSVRCLAR